jgi:hypothetical protein
MRSIYLTILFILCLLTGFGTRAQNSYAITGVVKDQKGETLPGATVFLINTQPNYLAEKVYLQLDKSHYPAGDTLWFKAYVVVGAKHQLSALSHVLYVELIDNSDSVKQRIRLFVQNGLCQGDLELPLTLESGNYRIRAYTNWMRNAGEEYFFDKTITVINPGIISKAKAVGETKALPAKRAIPNVDIQFFPEGGSLAVGIPSKIAFKATDANGLGININGIITDEQNNAVTTLASTHLGMGVFSLTAEAGKSYQAKVKLADSSVRIIPLPKAVNTGYVLNVSAAGPDHIRVIAQKTGDTETEPATLVAQSAGGIVYYEAKSKPGSNSFMSTIPKNKFPTGIVQFTLFSAQGEPLNERLMFIQNNDQLKLDVAATKQSYSPQQKVKIDLWAKTSENRPVQGSFSVSVVDETKVPVDADDNNILSNLLLTSSLKGYIEHPGYYFASPGNEKTADALDALMLTQGYRRFEWKRDTTMGYVPEAGLEISGYLKTNSGRTIPNGKVTLFATGGNIFTLDTIADSKGHFAFTNLFFSDSTRFMLQGATEKERNNLQISLDKPAWPKVGKNNHMPEKDNRTEQLAPFTEASKVKYTAQEKYHINDKSKLLKEVTINDYAKPVLKHSDNLNGPGNADYVFTAKDIASFKCGFISSCLEGRMPGVTLSNKGDGAFYLTRLLAMSMSGPAPPMLVLINGAPENMDLLAPNSIESIEVLTNMGHTAVYAGKGNAGIILITTKRGADEVDMTVAAPGTITYRTKGFEKVREFYSPPYDDPQTNKEIADLRTTIYWNPMVQTDKDGNAYFEYFNAGSKGNYKVVVEGIDYNGNLGRVVYRYKVE